MSAKKGGAKPPRNEDDDDLELSSVSSDSEDEEQRAQLLQQQQKQQPQQQRRKSTLMTQNILSKAQQNHHTLLANAGQLSPHPPEGKKSTSPQERPTHHVSPRQFDVDGKKSISPQDRPLNTGTTPRPPEERNPHEQPELVAQRRSVSNAGSIPVMLDGSSNSLQMARRSSSQGSIDASTQPKQNDPFSSKESRKSVVQNTALLPALTTKRTSVVNLRRAMSIHQNGDDGEADPDSDQKPANAKVKKIVVDIREAQSLFRRDFGDKQGAISDAGFQELRDARRQLEQAKLNAANELNAVAGMGSLIVDHPEVKRLVQKCIEELLLEGDKRGNGELVNAFIEHISTIDFTAMILVRQYVQFAVKEGNPKFFETFMSLPNVLQELSPDQLQDIILHATTHPIHRVAMLTTVLKYVPQSPHFPIRRKDFSEPLQTAFESIVSIARVIPTEDREGRPDLIAVGVKQPYINFDTREGHDKQTIFSRAAREGDHVLVSAIIAANRVEDVNRIQSDCTNALQQAAARGHLDTVLVLCKHPSIGASLTYSYPSRGTAVDIVHASKIKHSQHAIVNALKVRMSELGLIEKKDFQPGEEESQGGTPHSSPTIPEKHASFASLGLQRRGSGARRGSNGGSGANPVAKRHSVAGGTAAGAVVAETQDPDEVVDGTNIVRILASVIKPLYEQIKYEESFDPKGDDMRKVNVLKEDLEKAKDTMAVKLSKLGNFIEVRKEEVRDDVINIMDHMITETSKLGGNIQLFEILLSRLALNFDYVAVATDKNWFARSAENGSLEYLDLLLTLPNIKASNETNFQTKLMFEGASMSRIYRVDAMLKLFEYENELNLSFFQAILKPVWQAAFVEIASLEGARPQEKRSNRMILLKMMMTHPIAQCDPEKPDSTGHCVFSRACAEGDAPLVFLLLNPQSSPLKNVNAEYKGMTSIMHAIMNDRKEILQMFIQLASALPTPVNDESSWLSFYCKSMNGSPLHVAIVKGKDEATSALKQAGVILKRRKSVAQQEEAGQPDEPSEKPNDK